MYTVIIIDDSLSMRNILKNIIDNMEDFRVVYTASDAYEAREKIKYYEPDLVTIDINMPKMDGITFLRNLMRLHPMPAVIISGESVKGNDIFGDGAVGFIEKPSFETNSSIFQTKIKETLLSLTYLLKQYKLKKPKSLYEERENKKKSSISVLYEKKIEPDSVYPSKPAYKKGSKIIGIGSSTGGVDALVRVFEKLPSNLPPIVITQHIPYGFSNSFAQRLNAISKVNVSQLENDTILENGYGYLAPGNMHLVVELIQNRYVAKLLDIVKVNRHKPSVDIMFRSINNSAGGGAMAVIMTGMGDDGAIGIKEIFDNGGYTIAQSEDSCVVYGMPKQAVLANGITKIVHLDNIAQSIIEYSNEK